MSDAVVQPLEKDTVFVIRRQAHITFKSRTLLAVKIGLRHGKTYWSLINEDTEGHGTYSNFGQTVTRSLTFSSKEAVNFQGYYEEGQAYLKANDVYFDVQDSIR